MRITFVLPEFPRVPVGGFRVVYEYANHLAARGHQVSVVHPRTFDDPPPGDVSGGLRRTVARLGDTFFPPQVDWQPIDPRVQMRVIPDLGQASVPSGDAIFATAWETAEYILRYPVSKGEKFYLVMDFGSWFGPQERLEETWRWPLKKVTISSWLYRQVCAAGAAPQDVVNIPIGIDHQRFRRFPERRRVPGTVAMYCGAIGYKAVEDGLEALRIAQARFPQAKVALFGHPVSPAVALPGWIAHRGHVDEQELVAIYNQTEVFVSSSIAEGFALPPAEAMACGCAVAATDSGGIREFAEHEATALLSPPRDPEALARNIVRLLNDDELSQRLAAAGQRRIQEFTWERSTDQLEQFIQLHAADRVGNSRHRGSGTPR